MKRIFSIAIIIALLLVSPVSFASVGYQKDGSNEGNASKIDFRNGYTTFDGSTVSFYANGYGDGVTTNVSTESNLSDAALAYGVILLQGHTSTKYINLEAGTAGQVLTICMTQYNTATVYITDDQVSPAVRAATVTTGWDDIGFDAVGEMVTLLYVDDSYGWIIVGLAGATVTQ